MLEELQTNSVDQLYSSIVRYTLRRCSDIDLAEQVVSDIFCNLWEGQEFQDKPLGYLCASARNRLINYYRDDRKLVPIEDAINKSLDLDHRPIEEEVAEKFAVEEKGSIMQEIVSLIATELTPLQRRAFLLRTVEEHSVVETAKLLKISEHAAQSLFRKAVLKIRNKLGVHAVKRNSCSYGACKKEPVSNQGYCKKHLQVTNAQKCRRYQQRKNGWS